MVKTEYDLAVIGGGPAGLAAALKAWELGLRKIIILERDREAGGILNQCIHNGFGLHYFKEELTGPEYACRWIRRLEGTSITLSLETMVLELCPNRGEDHAHLVRAVRRGDFMEIRARSIVLATGCRERTRFALAIPGTRPSGIFTAGQAQRYVNLEGKMPGEKVVILGSGDIGLIMARRLTLIGARVLACVEILDHPGGLRRNINQCLEDFNIPLLLSSTITQIQGEKRISGVRIAGVDADKKPRAETERFVECDTLLLSVGLIPENELTRAAGLAVDPKTGGACVDKNMAVFERENCPQTYLRPGPAAAPEKPAPGIFAAGNVVHVLDLVDKVSVEGEKAGAAAASMLI